MPFGLFLACGAGVDCVPELARVPLRLSFRLLDFWSARFGLAGLAAG